MERPPWRSPVLLLPWLLACRSPEVPDDTDPPGTTDTDPYWATDDPPLTCSGVEVDYLVWGELETGGNCISYRRRDLLDLFPPGPTCDTPWVNHGSYDMEGAVVDDECRVDQTLDEWCSENLPCWEDEPTCPHLADLLWMLGATDPASTYEWSGVGGTGSSFDYVFNQCTDQEDLYFHMTLIGLDFEQRGFSFHSAPGVSLDDAELISMRVGHDYYRLPQP